MKLILEMTLAVLVRTVVERIKAINRYNGYAAEQRERQQLKMARLALGKGKALPWSRFNKHIVYNNQIVFLPVPLDLSTACTARWIYIQYLPVPLNLHITILLLNIKGFDEC